MENHVVDGKRHLNFWAGQTPGLAVGHKSRMKHRNDDKGECHCSYTLTTKMQY